MISKSILENLYSNGLSMTDIAKKMSVSENQVVYWMNQYKIPRRDRSQASYLKSNPNGDPFIISLLDSNEKLALFSVGIGLFLGEGTKKTDHSVSFTNSDPKIIKLYLRFIREICGVKEFKIRAWLNIFDDSKLEKALTYWSNITNIQQERFYKTTVRRRKVGTYKNKNLYGTITILVGNKKLLHIINQWCSVFLSENADMAQWQSTFLVKRFFAH